MLTLAIDTSADLCAVCILDADGKERARSVTPLETGHAARLMAAIDDVLAGAGCRFQDLGRIAVTEGPGSFTGLRIGIAAARGLSLALGIPSVGVSALEALAAQARLSLGEKPVLALIDAHRGEIYAGLFDAAGLPDGAARSATVAEARDWAKSCGAVLTGSGAALVAATLKEARVEGVSATADIAVIARLAAAKPLTSAKPAPVYLRQPDAKTQAGFAVARK